ncbi:MAG: LuxR C-terminal-related transcriptional regulator [Aliishimia sp.]
MTPNAPTDLDHGKIVDQLYDIALDPGSLDGFIDAWNAAGLDSQTARTILEEIDNFDVAFQAHLRRAETFLHRNATEETPPLSDVLAPFENLAALIVDRSLTIIACNEGAASSFGVKEGDKVAKLPLNEGVSTTFATTLKDHLQATAAPDKLLNVELDNAPRATLFQLRRLTETDANGHPVLLIVTTQYHWQPALGQTLEEVFNLTEAEQGVVRALVEGSDAKAIAGLRGTSEGTVRSQIKSILAKMNARSQSEVIRLVMSLRDVSAGAAGDGPSSDRWPADESGDWLDREVWKPFATMTLPDGRRMDYHDMGPVNGAPVLYSHMGYGLARWTRPMLKMAFQYGLRVICPIRAGYGLSDNHAAEVDIQNATIEDTLALLDHLDIKRLPYLTQGSDLIFAVDLAANHPTSVSEIIGICARPFLPGDLHYANMGKWHRFFLSTARHAPHLLKFTAKAAVAMAKRIGVEEMFRRLNSGSASDMALIEDQHVKRVMIANAELIAGRNTDVSLAYARELLKTEVDWSQCIIAAKETPTWFVNGTEDPASNVVSLSQYREVYPWIDIEAVPNAGQLMLFQNYADLIPRIANSAHAALKG